MTSILLIAERDDQGDISQSTLQAITAANSLTDAKVIVAVAGDVTDSVSTLAVDKVVMISAVSAADDGIFERVTDDVAALVSLISPDVVILSKTDVGSVIGARLAFRIDAAFAADCIEISNSGDSVSVTRPVYGGSALAEYEIASSPAIVTLRAGAYEPTSDSGTPEVESFSSGATGEQRASVSDTIMETREGIRLEDANFIVRGVEASVVLSRSAFLLISQTCLAVPLGPLGRRATLDG